jgi:hypothetical protein
MTLTTNRFDLLVADNHAFEQAYRCDTKLQLLLNSKKLIFQYFILKI